MESSSIFSCDSSPLVCLFVHLSISIVSVVMDYQNNVREDLCIDKLAQGINMWVHVSSDALTICLICMCAFMDLYKKIW